MREYEFPPYLRAPFPTLGKGCVAVSDHPLASQAACRMFELGGNAVDAAVAMSLALNCTCPYYTGIGGGGFALVWLPGWEEPRWLDFRETAPRASSATFYEDRPAHHSWEGPFSVGVPGQVAGLDVLLREHGRLGWAEVVAPAVEMARSGVSVDANWYRVGLNKQADLARYPEAARLYLDHGSSPFPGTVLRFPDLAGSLEQLAEQGARAFYEGEIARRIVAELPDWLTLQDLADYRPRWREPLSLDWDGGRLFTVGAPSAGGLQLLQMLALLQKMGRCSVDESEFYHRLSEAMRISFRVRGEAVGDPDDHPLQLSEHLSPSWLEYWAGRIHSRNVMPLAGPALAYPGGGTASHAVACRDGGVVVLTESVNHWFGSMVVARGTGILLNNIMDDFSTKPHHPDQFGVVPSKLNLPLPGRRSVSSSAPSLWFEDGRPRLAVGSAGGPRITTSVAQVLLQRRWKSQNIQQAISAPRIHHQWFPDELEVEPLFPVHFRANLEGRGHQLVERVCRSHACALECHWEEGFFSAGADFRSFGGAAAR